MCSFGRDLCGADVSARSASDGVVRPRRRATASHPLPQPGCRAGRSFSGKPRNAAGRTEPAGAVTRRTAGGRCEAAGSPVIASAAGAEVSRSQSAGQLALGASLEMMLPVKEMAPNPQNRRWRHLGGTGAALSGIGQSRSGDLRREPRRACRSQVVAHRRRVEDTASRIISAQVTDTLGALLGLPRQRGGGASGHAVGGSLRQSLGQRTIQRHGHRTSNPRPTNVSPSGSPAAAAIWMHSPQSMHLPGS